MKETVYSGAKYNGAWGTLTQVTLNSTFLNGSSFIETEEKSHE